MLHPKKVGYLPVDGTEKFKLTNEIKIAIPLLVNIDIEGKEITADALLTQHKIADYLVRERKAYCHFTVKNNQHGIYKDIAFYFKERGKPDFVDYDPPDHGRIEIGKIWATTELNDYLDFPHIGQAFVIQREITNKKSGEYSCGIADGLTSCTPEQADPKRLLVTNRGHWSIENSCHLEL